MTDRFTVKTVYNTLSQYIRNRADIGANKAVRDAMCSNRPTHLTGKPQGHPGAGLCCSVWCLL